MDNIEKNSIIMSIQPVRKIRAQIYDRERRELKHRYERRQRRQATKRQKPRINRTPNLTTDSSTPEKHEQALIEYKSDLKTRLAFDRALLLHEKPSSE